MPPSQPSGAAPPPSQTRSSDSPREIAGAFLRSLIEFLYARGIFESVRQRVSPATRERMERPPFALSWMPSDPVDEIEAAVFELLGRDALVDLGVFIARSQGRTLVQPLLQIALSAFGQSPAAVLGRLDWFAKVTTRGLDFTWEPLSETSGIVRARFRGAHVPQPAYDVLEGTLRFAPELCRRKGAVEQGPLEAVDETGATAVYRVSWT